MPSSKGIHPCFGNGNGTIPVNYAYNGISGWFVQASEFVLYTFKDLATKATSISYEYHRCMAGCLHNITMSVMPQVTSILSLFS